MGHAHILFLSCLVYLLGSINGAAEQNIHKTNLEEENKKLIKMISDMKTTLTDLKARNALLEKQYQDLLREYESIESEHTVEMNRLKEEITSLRAEMETILQDLQVFQDKNLSLEHQVVAYKKQFEKYEKR